MGHYVRKGLPWICLCANLVVGAAPFALPLGFQGRILVLFVRASAGVGAGGVLRNSCLVHSALRLSLGVIDHL